MRVQSRLISGARVWGGLGLAVAAMVWALSGISPAAAGASPAAHPASGAVGMTLSQAPPALRAAIERTAAAGGPAAPSLKQRAELTASDAASGDAFGRAVAVSGSTAVVGAPYHNSSTGTAYVFVRSGTTWSQQAELTPSDGAPGTEFGYSVAASGSTVVVGAIGRNSFTGAAYVFVRSGTKWSQQAELTASDGAMSDEIGSSVAVAGSTALVGAPHHNLSTGAAYVFVRSGTTWSQQAELTASGGASGDQLGYTVALSPSTAVVAAPYRNSVTGAAYVFVRSGTTWSQQAELTASDGASGDTFGFSVAVSGSTAFVGAPFRNSSTGAAYVFTRSGTAWPQQAELTAGSGASFGFSVAVSASKAGSTAVVSGPSHSSATGAAYTFVRSGTTWSRRANLKASDGASGDEFGYSATMSGSTVVVGAPFSSTGAAYVFGFPSARS